MQRPQEDALATFIAGFDDCAVTARTLAHAWTGGSGDLVVGSRATRLVVGNPQFTAGTIYAPSGGPGRLELSRVLMERHGLGNDQWTHWSDEFADLGHLGFDQGAKYPSLPITPDITPAELVRLVQGLRDLAKMLG